MTRQERLNLIDKMLSDWIKDQNKIHLRIALHEAIIEYEQEYNVSLEIEIVERKKKSV